MAISAIEWAMPGTALLLVICILYGWWRASSVRSGLLARDLGKTISFGSPQQDLRLSDIITNFRDTYGGDFIIFPGGKTASHVGLVFQAEVDEAVQRGESFRLVLDMPLPGFPLLLGTREYMHVPRPIESVAGNAKTFDIDEIVINKQAFVCFAGLSIGRMKIHRNFGGTIFVRACRVEDLVIGEVDTPRENAVTIEGTLQIEESRVGLLVLKEEACRNLFLSNTIVGKVHCGGGNPFTGVVLMTGRVTLHYRPSKMDAESLANYSNLRAHLSAHSQETSAMFVRSVELRALRKSETWFLRVVSLLYDLTSDYGNRPQLAGLTLCLLLAVNLLVISGLDASVVTADCAGIAAETWIGVLCERGWVSEVLAELLLSAEPVLNPFGVLSAYPVEAEEPGVALWLWLARVLSIVLAGLVIIGIRRRIRL